jgi:predicted anti-sigma-YlaC factor YlaD
VDCEVAREALSARLDGEREPVPAPRVDEHVATCEPCREWYAVAVDHTQLLRRLSGRSQVAAVATPTEPATRPPATIWRRCALGLVGGLQLGLAVAQGFGANIGTSAGYHAMMSGHLLNESTAWSVALGAMMVIAAVRPGAAAGLTVVLAVYVVSDTLSGAVTVGRILSHLPVLLGTVLALLVCRDARSSGPQPHSDAAPVAGDLVLPDNAARGRRRGHLYPTDGSAA